MSAETAEIRCTNAECRKLLAKRTGDVLEIKFSRLTVNVEGARRVSLTCPRCECTTAVEPNGEVVRTVHLPPCTSPVDNLAPAQR